MTKAATEKKSEINLEYLYGHGGLFFGRNGRCTILFPFRIILSRSHRQNNHKAAHLEDKTPTPKLKYDRY